MKLFSKFVIVLLCICICFGLSCCQSNDSRNASNYNEEYYEGYKEGLRDGAFECKKYFANTVRDRYSDVEHATKNGRYFHPEEAIIVLNDYLDGEYVSDAELEAAIESITDFYYDWQSVIANIEELDVDIFVDGEYISLD